MSEENNSNDGRSGGRTALYIAIGAAVLGLLLVCVFAFLIFCQDGGCGDTLIRSEPTPTPIVNQLPPVNLAPPVIEVDIDSTDAVSLTLDLPSVLSVAGQDFPVQPSSPNFDGVWQPTINSPTTSTWLNPTIINYVFAIQDTPENRVLVTSLERGDEIVMTAQSGKQRTFNFNSRNLVPASQRDVFSQTSPSLTLVLIGAENSDRLVVKGKYRVEEAIQNIGPEGGDSEDNIAQLGDVVQLGDIQIAAALFDNRPQEGSGLAYYLVDYQVQNIGTAPIDTSQIRMTLVDGIGNGYVLDVEASQAGNHRPLPAQLNIGESTQATAGYQIPSGLDYNSLGWLVERIDTGETVEIRVAAPEGDTEEFSVQINANAPQLSPDAAQLFLTGSIANIGGDTAIIDASNVSFESEGANYFVLSTKPAFPWVIQPGEVLEYELAVQRPINSDTSVFTILNQSFQVTNYR